MDGAATDTAEIHFRAIAEGAPGAILLVDGAGCIRFANRATEPIFGYPHEELVGLDLTDLVPERLRERAAEALQRIFEDPDTTGSGVWEIEVTARTRDGGELPVGIEFGEYRENGQHLYSGIVTDRRGRIAEADRAEGRLNFLARASAELADSLDEEKTLRTIARLAVPEIADWSGVDLLTEEGTLRRLAVHHQDPAKVAFLQELAERFPPSPDSDAGTYGVVRRGETVFIPELADEDLARVANDEEHLRLLRKLGIRSYICAPLIAHGRVKGAITLACAESGRTFAESDCTVVEDLARRAGVAVYNSHIVRELKAARGALEDQANELKRRGDELSEAIQRLNLHVLQTPLAAIDCDPEARVVAWNPAAERIFGYTADEAIGRPAGEVVGQGADSHFDATVTALLHQKQPGERSTHQHRTRDGRSIYCRWYSTPLVTSDGKLIGVGSLVEDVTEMRNAELLSARQVDHLNALRAIDLAITSSLDLRVTLTVLLDQVVSQLAVDAAAVFVLNLFTQRLEFAAGRGFRSLVIQETDLQLGEGVAGSAAIHRRTISVMDLPTSSEFTRKDLVKAEEFVTHHCTPLVSKGRVTGILEVYTRSHADVDSEWISFLEALAGQAAIAVESAHLFEDLQRSNLELVLAYDTTLEGWSRALDLRDDVTEGHSRRVTEMTVRLARALGVEDADLVHIRRGALLHDIGKVGIPDSILKKAGPLTDEEWEVMRKHPEYAFQLLSPIEFLRPALDIPYGHHERWDGTGYPRQLKGEEIPFAARIFAVVDVWDALRSDRAYSPSWPEEKIREHIRGLAGNHLDPQVVEAFLALESE